MKAKKQYYKLDDIGFIGTQEDRSPAQVKKDMCDMEKYIKLEKSRKSKAAPSKKKPDQ